MIDKTFQKIIVTLAFCWPLLNFGQTAITDFVSINPQSQRSKFRLPSSHTVQDIILKGDSLTQGGVLGPNADFTGYVPINNSSINGYLSVNSETTPGAASMLEIKII